MSDNTTSYKATAAILGAAMAATTVSYSYDVDQKYKIKPVTKRVTSQTMNAEYSMLLVDANIGEAIAKMETQIATTDSKFDRIMAKLSALESVPGDISALQSKIGSKWVTFIAQAIATVLAVGTFLALLLNGIQFGQMLPAATPSAATPAAAEPLVIESKPNELKKSPE